MSKPKRIGIMTGGGDCPGLNAVIRAATKVAIRSGWEVLGIEDACGGLIEPHRRAPKGNVLLGRDHIRDILTRGGTILGTSNRSDPFRYVQTVDGVEQETDISDRVMENFKKLGLSAMISIGGDGSMAISQRFFEKGMPIVGVPKTIDNDLGATDVTFGFNTAVGIATEALDRIRDTAESHDRVMLVEVMGRHAGWIALESGLAAGAHGILIPEIPYEIEKVAAMVKERRKRGQYFSVIVVAEGAKPKGGRASMLKAELGEMPRLMGAATLAAEGLKQHIDAEMRVTVLGHVQRGGSPSPSDRILATRFGHRAAELVAEEAFGQMVALQNGKIISVPIADAIDSQKLVEPDSELVATGRAMGVTFGD